MSKIAFLDHSHHRITKSTEFLPTLLRRYNHTVDVFWDESWNGGKPIFWQSLSEYDIIIMFQSICKGEVEYFRKIHPNVIFIPMLDQFGVWQGPLFNLTQFWEPFHGCKVISFSNAIHGMVTGFGIKSFNIRYYPPINKFSKSIKTASSNLNGFFWLRREKEVSWKIVKELITGTEFSSFHIHIATDPNSGKPTLPNKEEIEIYNITTSTWFENKVDFERTLNGANIYFVPRIEEGIGRSFLEAFLREQCVVAPNEGTMNEYILDGCNGILYDWKDPKPLDFTQAINYGKNAFELAKKGRQLWESKEDDLVKYIETPCDEFYVDKYQHFTYHDGNSTISQSAETSNNKIATFLPKTYNKFPNFHVIKNFKDVYLYFFIKKSGLFDKEFYFCTYPEVYKSGLDPIIHYIKIGWLEEKNPSPNFDTRFYINQNIDVAESGVNPLFHYLRWGCKEGRQPKSKII